MKNVFLQFLKRQSLANALSATDLLSFFAKTEIFAPYRFLAKIFHRRRTDAPLYRIRDFLKHENDEVLAILADEIWSRYATGNEPLYPAPDSLLPQGPFCLCRNLSEQTRRFYADWLKEIGFLTADILSVCARRWNLRRDMRLYAADWQELTDSLQSSSNGFFWQIDWLQTSASCLWITSAEPFRITSRLSLEEQKNLANLFAELLFDKGYFISSWSGVAVNEAHQVLWADFDALFPADSELKKFAFSYLQAQKFPTGGFEHKLAAALRRLQFFTPEVDLLSLWQPWAELIFEPQSLAQITNVPAFQDGLRRHGLDFLQKKQIQLHNPQELRYLLDSSRHAKDPRFRKSSIFYWLPLVIAIYLLLKYF